MTNTSIYQDMAQRTGGDIYLGLVGPVRTGKSTFIRRFMETLVIPNIEDVYARERAKEMCIRDRCLSVFETEVLFHFLDGLSYRQIAEAVGRTEKAVDNAVQRIRRKLARQPFLGDISRS